MIEGTRLEAVENIAKYQKQTRNWRDSKVIRKIIQDGDLVLRRRPNAEKGLALLSSQRGL